MQEAHKDKVQNIQRLGKDEKRRETKAKRKNRMRFHKDALGRPKGTRAGRYEAMEPKDLPTFTEEQKLDALNTTSSTIMQNPEGGINLLKDLLVLLQDDSPQVITHTLNKLCDVFIDIMPSYKIRVDSTEDESRLSKDVFQLRKYESGLLESYAKYLKITQAFLKVKARQTKDEASKAKIASIKETAFDCMCRLLENLPHINYARSIMLLVVAKLTSSNEKMRARSMVAIKDLLSSHEHSMMKLELKLKTAKEVGRMIKSKSHKTFDRKVLSIFEEHKIIVSKGETQEKSNPKLEELRVAIKKKRGKGKKKEARELEKSLLKELRETSATAADVGQITRYNTEILREILSIYLGVLKDNPKSPLLISVFEGLPRLAPHIDIEIVSDCLDVMRSYLKTAFLSEDSGFDLRNLTAALRSSIRMAQTLSSSFEVDERSFINYGFKLFDYFVTKPEEMLNEDCTGAMLGAVEQLFVTKKQLSLDVVAAYCKKIAVIALKLPEEYCAKFVKSLEAVMLKYSRLHSLLEADESAVEPQIFLKGVEDPQMMLSASSISIAGEITQLKQKYTGKNKDIIASIRAITSAKA